MIADMKTMQMVLEKDSSVLGYPGEISKPLDADHHSICKYESPEDPGYITVRNVLKSLVGKAEPKRMSHIIKVLLDPSVLLYHISHPASRSEQTKYK